MEINVLALNLAGYPIHWLTPQEACFHYAKGHVVYDLGDVTRTFRGGYQNSGDRSEIDIKSIIAIDSEKFSYHRSKMVPQRQSELLFRRDLHICAYCGMTYSSYDLTKDHILPSSRGGDNSWTNLVSCCFDCNSRKADRTPEEAGMELLYVPYEPCLNERFILAKRNILADQMEYLKAKLPAHSRHC